MSDLSIGEAYGAGLRVIARRPLAPLVWGLVVFAVVCLPIVLIVTSAVPGFVRAAQESAATGQASPAPVFAAFGSLMMLQPVFFLGSIAVRAVLFAAVFRAVYEPERSKAFYMRFGVDELWQGLVFLCLQILLGMAAFAAFFPLMFGLIASVAGASGAPNQAGAAILQVLPAFVLATLAVVALVGWLAVRLSLALPMTFTDRQFRLFESWGATRGHTLALIGLALLQIATLLVLEAIVIAVVFAVLAALIGVGGESAWMAWFNRAPQAWGPGLGLAVTGACLVGSILSGYLAAFIYAPWADAWRQIKGDYRSDHFGPAPSTAPLG